MKKSKLLIVLALVGIICFSLCACGISREEAVGTWSGTYVYEGNTFAVAIVLSEEGNYGKASYKNGSFNSSESGTWEIKGGKVVLHRDGDMGVSTEYKYKGDALVNNVQKLYKK